MTKKIVLFIMFLLIAPELFSQVNTETMRKDFKGDGLFNQIQCDFGYTSGNTEYAMIRAGYRADYIDGLFHYFGIVSYGYAEEDKIKNLNKGFIHLRCVYDLAPRLALEAFSQKEFNEFILLKDRNLLGGGGRVQILDLYADSGKGVKLYSFVGAGAMLEHEVLDTKPGTKSSLIGRMTSYLSIGAEMTPNFALKIVNYYQPKLTNFDDFRFLTEGSLNFKISKYLAFKTSMQLRYDSQPPPDVKSTDFNILNGFQVDF